MDILQPGHFREVAPYNVSGKVMTMVTPTPPVKILSTMVQLSCSSSTSSHWPLAQSKAERKNLFRYPFPVQSKGYRLYATIWKHNTNLIVVQHPYGCLWYLPNCPNNCMVLVSSSIQKYTHIAHSRMLPWIMMHAKFLAGHLYSTQQQSEILYCLYCSSKRKYYLLKTKPVICINSP